MTLPTYSDTTISRKTAWSGKVLIPLWTLQIAASFLNIVSYCMYLSQYQDDSHWSNIEINKSTKTFSYISAVILIFLWALALFMIVFQIVRFHKKNLPAKTMLTMQTILFVFSVICFALELLGIFVLTGGYKTILDFFGSGFAMFFFLGTFIYTSVIHRRRKLAKRASKNSYGMQNYDEEAVPSKNNTKVSTVE
ncbi:hypothetical protein AUEXF2481DRAFT_92332 [Aureobasidium subglaciale EXF-2481]|uniref:MARVEL domain-containing protein n=1 Tax=Aureobasidium subglaciale (strain EXF-2481) TaxID=1043005 RepID=A0A074YWB5_AURSE|nr:uncharacterized protein AUEXF2481DRAFT_92332 [Aureobasidium subglaciale EXF-2481]KAI5196541.1 hypothetical protein E4T38_08484 [Aureobasidium subglaciale]KAI5215337.1 hypothetical protein E4T40_08497 [Aureobasidium subglaciale]KAI5218577.1 hypothetical protein E4T41_08350 [Aureobasidium subglaciale]KAI5256141.1 hypothetical protein E4T46_08385 [Aureobasidium subglaciale]KEQ91131.1 hypothetical protein AUEXF2481DRAFT_92332 [Aureobasidium subglaciale EXF-2481]